jgi:hypothetical protein
MNEELILKLASKKIKSILDKRGLVLLTPDICEQYFLFGNGLIYKTSNLYYLDPQDNYPYVVSNFTTGKGDVISSDYLITRNHVIDNWEPKGHKIKEEFTTDIKSEKHNFYKIIKASCTCIRKGEFSAKESSIFIEPNIKDFTSPETFDTFKDLYSFTKI